MRIISLCGVLAAASLLALTCPTASRAGTTVHDGRAMLAPAIDKSEPAMVGFVQYSNYLDHFTFVQGEWIVPTVDTRIPGDQNSSQWVGIDGTNKIVRFIQAGTSANNVDGIAQYYAWTEVFTDDENTNGEMRTSLKINAGDAMMVTIEEEATNDWQITIKDYTTSRSVSQKFDNYSTPGLSAEAILERPTVDGQVSTLATTSDISFSAVVGSGLRGEILYSIGGLVPDATLYRIFMVDGGRILASPSVMSEYSACFTVADGNKVPAENCPRRT